MPSRFFNLHSSQARWTIISSLFIAFVLDTMILFGQAIPVFPPLTLFVLLYWCAHFLDRTHLFSAFILGLFADTLYQTTLGAHALLFVIITFLMLRHRLRFKAYPVWQQAFVIGIYLFLYQALNFVFFSPILDDGNFVPYWTMPAASIIAWPILSQLLRKVSHTAAQG